MNTQFHPLVSIVIPVYNGSNYLREAIDSALAQTYDNIEILVINDGSNDNGATEAIAKSYGDKIRYFSKENGGTSTALNVGIENMRGEYFSWLSHDDVYLPYKVERQVEFISFFELYDSIIYSNFYIIDKYRNFKYNNIFKYTNPENLFLDLYIEGFINGCTLLIPKKILLKYGMFNSNYITTQDYELWIRIAKSESFVGQNEILVGSRQHDEQGCRTSRYYKKEVSNFYNKNLRPTLYHLEKTNYLGKKAVADALISIIKARINQRQYLAALYAITFIFINPILIFYKIKFTIPKRWKVSGNDFNRIYLTNGFAGGGQSASGSGSTLIMTRTIRNEIPNIILRYNIKKFLDAPCGDFNWMKFVDMKNAQYIGCDIVDEIIKRNNNYYRDKTRTFRRLNLLDNIDISADAIFSRDFFVHLPNHDIKKVINNIKKANITYLITTHFTERDSNSDLVGVWRPINFCKEPFNFVNPLEVINEKCFECGGIYKDKCIAIWEVNKLPYYSI